MNLPWIGVQHWKTPAFFHWRVPYDTLRALVPSPFELDTFNNETWVSVVPFQATKTYPRVGRQFFSLRSEEHTSELQSRGHLVCRLLLEKTNHQCVLIIGRACQ